MNKTEKKKRDVRKRNEFRVSHRKDDIRFEQYEDKSGLKYRDGSPRMAWRFRKDEDTGLMLQKDLRNRSKTRQSDEHASNINNICKNLTHADIITMAQSYNRLNLNNQVVDLTEVGDFQSLMLKAMEMQNKFNELSRTIQERFKTPEALFEWLADPRNQSEAVDLGFVRKEDVETSSDPAEGGEGVEAPAVPPAETTATPPPIPEGGE